MPISQYSETKVAVADLKQIFPIPLINAVPEQPASHARSTKYDECEFLRLCIWEAHQNHMLDSPAACVRRLDELLSVIWGEEKTPGLTWLKKKVGEIYKARKTYQRGCQPMPGKGSTDRR